MTDLCWKCKRELEEYYGCNIEKIDYPLARNAHCHHEPKEKKECWCQTPKNNRSQATRVFEDSEGRYKWFPVSNFCPECGRKLNE